MWDFFFLFWGGFERRMWDLIVSVPDHCLSFYFKLCISSLPCSDVDNIHSLPCSSLCGCPTGTRRTQKDKTFLIISAGGFTHYGQIWHLKANTWSCATYPVLAVVLYGGPCTPWAIFCTGGRQNTTLSLESILEGPDHEIKLLAPVCCIPFTSHCS